MKLDLENWNLFIVADSTKKTKLTITSNTKKLEKHSRLRSIQMQNQRRLTRVICKVSQGIYKGTRRRYVKIIFYTKIQYIAYKE